MRQSGRCFAACKTRYRPRRGRFFLCARRRGPAEGARKVALWDQVPLPVVVVPVTRAEGSSLSQWYNMPSSTATVTSPGCAGGKSGSSAAKRDPIPDALETDWPVGAAGFATSASQNWDLPRLLARGGRIGDCRKRPSHSARPRPFSSTSRRRPLLPEREPRAVLEEFNEIAVSGAGAGKARVVSVPDQRWWRRLGSDEVYPD